MSNRFLVLNAMTFQWQVFNSWEEAITSVDSSEASSVIVMENEGIIAIDSQEELEFQKLYGPILEKIEDLEEDDYPNFEDDIVDAIFGSKDDPIKH